MKKFKPATRRDMDKLMNLILMKKTEDITLSAAEAAVLAGKLLGTRSHQTLVALNGLGYIENTFDTETGRGFISLTSKGWTYFEERRQQKRDLCINGVLLPILVSFATTLLTKTW